MIRWHARWIFPGNGPPIAGGLVTVEGGRIQEVQTGVHSPPADAQALGDVALLPGLINAHTHLEFSHLPAPLSPASPFPDWIRRVIATRRSTEQDPPQRLQLGLDESLTSGVTGIGEIATSDDLVREPLCFPAPRLLVVREVLGLAESAVESQRRILEAFLKHPEVAGGPQRGLSPHAPYSVRPELLDLVCEFAEQLRLPVAMHLAESPAEMELLESQSGPLVDMLRELGVWQEGLFPRGGRPIDSLRRLSSLPRVLVIHCNLLSDEEIEFLGAHDQISVVYCPRTHAAMQTGAHPFRRMLSAGVNVSLGTDSRASNPDLQIWRELGFLEKRHPEFPASELLELATSRAARALGWDDCGVLAEGKVADILAVRLSPPAITDPQRGLFAGTPLVVMRAGEVLPAMSTPENRIRREL